MRFHQNEFEVRTRGRGLYELTHDLQRTIAEAGVDVGLAVVFCQHTSASLLIQENADPTAASDLLAWLERLAPDGDPRYEHVAEGPDDMPAHLRSAVTRSSESIPVRAGRATLGTWQGVFLVEHRRAAHLRHVLIHVQGV